MAEPTGTGEPTTSRSSSSTCRWGTRSGRARPGASLRPGAAASAQSAGRRQCRCPSSGCPLRRRRTRSRVRTRDAESASAPRDEARPPACWPTPQQAQSGRRRGRAWTRRLAPAAQPAFGDEPATLAETGPRSDEFFVGATAASVPVARSTTRVPPPPAPPSASRSPPATRRRRAAGAAPAPRDTAPHHAAGDRLRHSGGSRPGGGLLRPQVVRLRQLDRDVAGRADRREARSTRWGPVVPSKGGRPHRRTRPRHDQPESRGRPRKGGCPASRRCRPPRSYVTSIDHPAHDDHHHDDDTTTTTTLENRVTAPSPTTTTTTAPVTTTTTAAP